MRLSEILTRGRALRKDKAIASETKPEPKAKRQRRRRRRGEVIVVKIPNKVRKRFGAAKR